MKSSNGNLNLEVYHGAHKVDEYINMQEENLGQFNWDRKLPCLKLLVIYVREFADL